ncbi:MAG: helix-turn-helix domain-containing protein [Bacteroidales bacterium]|nr:helix-turn-helix domain-containing protein [Bacteroidales bacterium]
MESKINSHTVEKHIFIKNMIGKCCIRMLRIIFEQQKIEVISLVSGEAEIRYKSTEWNEKKLAVLLEENGFGLILSREKRIVELTKLAIVELIHELNNMNSIVQKSDYLVEKIGLSYQQISKLFSKHEPITLERFIILNKIERVKELILTDEYTLSEIAYLMDYSSVQYLSNQFKKETGYSVTDYKKEGLNLKINLDELY